jgi:dipeptidyl aminopeptidase/acylaminoacyl peptidase
MDGGEPRELFNPGGGPVGALSWSPTGKELVFQHIRVEKLTDEERTKRPAFKHITSLWHKEDGFGWFRGETWTLWRVSFATGKAKALTPGDTHDHSPRWSPDGKRIAFSSARGKDRDRYPDQTDIFVMDRTGRNVRSITPGTGSREVPRWSLDGKHIYWIGYRGGPGEWLRHESEIWRSPASGRGQPQPLNPGHDRWPMNMVGTDTNGSGFGVVLEPYMDGDEERVAFGSDEEGSYRIYSVPARGGARPRLEVGGKLSVLGLSVPAEGCAVYLATTASDLGEFHSVCLNGTGETRRLTKITRPFFRPLRYRKPEEFHIRSGPHDMQCWVVKPPGYRKGRKYPCLIQVHGGPMTQYGETWFHEMQVLAAQGWVVAYCNPRGSSGRGMRFMNCIDGKWGRSDWNDIQNLTNHMARRPYVNARRMGILGGSYGGFMTTWAVGHTNRYRAGVTQRQAGDFWVHYGSSDYGHYRRFSFGANPWEDPDTYHRASPNFFVKNIRTPLLIIHSEGDLRCPIAESEGLFTAMKVLDQAPCEMVRFENEFHGLSRSGKPLNREERLKRIVDWFERYL